MPKWCTNCECEPAETFDGWDGEETCADCGSVVRDASVFKVTRPEPEFVWSEGAKPIPVAIVNDERESLAGMPVTDADEREDIAYELQSAGIGPLCVVYSGTNVVEGMSAEPELAVLDYGGASGYGGGRATSTVSYILDWAREHPNRLVVLWTAFTAQAYEGEMHDLEKVPNLVWRTSDYDRKEEARVHRTIRKWFKLPEPT